MKIKKTEAISSKMDILFSNTAHKERGMNNPAARIRVDQLFFYLALFLYLLDAILNTSLYTNIFPRTMFRLIELAVLGICAMKWMITERFTLKKFVVWGFFLGICAIVALKNGYYTLLVTAAMIISAEDFDFDQILKMTGLYILFGLLLVIASCEIGILPDYTFVHKVGSSSTTAHSLGFKYYSTLGYMSMTLTIIYLYFRKNISYFKLLLLVALNYLFFRIHSTNLSFYMTMAFIAGYVVVIKWKFIRFKSRFWRLLATILPAMLPLGTIGLVVLYSWNLLKISIPFLNTIKNRFEYSKQAIEKYGLNLLGAKVEMYGNTDLQYGTARSAFYIDSGYIYSLIAYGLLFTAVIILVYVLITRKIYEKQQPFLYLWIMMILCACCINNFLVSLLYNPLLFILSEVLAGEKKRLNTPKGGIPKIKKAGLL